MSDKMEIRIKNWEKYNPRKDVKKASWFRLQNDLFDDHELFNLDPTELAFLVYLFCLASKKNSENLVLSIAHATAIGRFDQATIQNALNKLTEAKIIIISDTSRARTARGTCLPATDGRTDEQDEQDEQYERGTKKIIQRSRAPAARAAAPINSVTEIKEAFLEAYRKEFNREYPGWGVKQNSQAKNWLKSISLDKAKELCSLYPKWNKPFVVKTGHQFGTLTTDYVELDAWAKGHDQLVRKIAKGKAIENVEISNAVMEEESNHAHKLYAERRNKNLGGRGEPELQDQTEREFSKPRISLF